MTSSISKTLYNLPVPTADEAERLAYVIIEKYVIRANTKKSCIAVLLKSKELGAKNWISGRDFLNSRKYARAIRDQTKGFGVRHSKYTDTLILDIDSMDLKEKAEQVLGGLQLGYVCIPSGGKGYHYWIKFDSIPARFRSEWGSAGRVITSLGIAIREMISPGGEKIDIRGDGGAVIKLPGWDPYYEKYIVPEGCSTWEQVIAALDQIPINPFSLVEKILPAHAKPRIKPRILNNIAGVGTNCEFQQLLDSVQINPGSTNDLSLLFVTSAFRAGMSPESIIALAKDFYEKRCAAGTWGARAPLDDWLRRVKSRIDWRLKQQYNLQINKARITDYDIKWVRTQNIHTNDAKFLLLHLVMSRNSNGGTYFLSMATAEKYGISSRSFRSRLVHFSNIIHRARRGERWTYENTECTNRKPFASEYQMDEPPLKGFDVEWNVFEDLLGLVTNPHPLIGGAQNCTDTETGEISPAPAELDSDVLSPHTAIEIEKPNRGKKRRKKIPVTC